MDAMKVYKCCCKWQNYCRKGPVQVGRGLPVETTESLDASGDETSEDEINNEASESEAGTTDTETDNIESSDDNAIEENGTDQHVAQLMADVMYICCQRPEKRRLMLENADRKPG